MAARTVVDPVTGCWNVRGCAVGPNGYAQIARDDGERVYAHRASWELVHGPIPDGQRILHRCDNPRCRNVDHLLLGTQADNIADCLHKNRRNAWGIQKLTVDDVRAIRELLAAGELHRVIAARFGVSRHHVTGIKNGACWGHLDAPKGIQESRPASSQQPDGSLDAADRALEIGAGR